MDKNEFMGLFESILKNCSNGSTVSKPIDRERLAVLEKVYEEFSVLFDGEPELKLSPRFSSGSVSVTTRSAELGRDKLEKLKSMLSECDTFSVDPLVDGRLSIAITIQHVFKEK